ncbi:lantibiotic dehydratase [Roseateles sp. DAIF2]|uniref:lantibiotic dehydratase n=1 Tax=Roseateles sp. DAIF2 TaxID=2714952 RepID=UPI0018A2DC15|nr:lantibiotic dehydratase [Roseateles sp. DAIF2]QPF72136.1 lantibiotic dehydratase [Roseateles sp. DAIF2]
MVKEETTTPKQEEPRLAPAAFVLQRHPLLPLRHFEDWSQSPDAERYVLAQYEQPWVEEGLYVSRPSLHARLIDLRLGQGEVSQHAGERKKQIASLARFLSRAAYRCTPFGLFAQVQLARVGPAAESAEPGAAPALRRGIHLDSGVEAWLIERALQDQGWRALLRWQLNNTAFSCGTHLSYVDWVYQANRQRSYRAVELAHSEALALLQRAAQSPQPFAALREELVRALAVEAEEAEAFLHQLIDKRLLLPQLAPTAGNGCSLDHALAQSPAHPALAPLREIQARLHALRAEADSAGSLVEPYQALRAAVEAQIGSEDLSRGVLQIDTLDARPAAVDPALAQGLVHKLELLMRHTARRVPRQQEYKRLFRARFEDREVNLAYALHPELGVPYPQRGALVSPLLEGLRLAPATAGEAGMGPALLPLEGLLLRRLFEQGAGGGCIALSEEDLKGLGAAPAPQLAEGAYAQLGQLPGAPGTEPKFELRGVGGRNGLELIARFCHLSPALSEAAGHYAREHRDAREDWIYAELIHHPQDRLLNILRRPSLASHELVYAGSSDKPREQQLWLGDLSIQLVGDRFLLRDRRSGRRVVPRLTSAHNYSARQLGAYEFLAGLQDEDAPWFGFAWPAAVQALPRLPRVELCGLILVRERWLLEAKQIEALNQAAVAGTVPAWREALGLPRFVTWDQHDNHLPVDLDNLASVSLLLDEIIKLPQVLLHECLALNAAAAQGCFEQRSREWLLPLRQTQKSAQPVEAAPWHPGRAALQDEGPRRPCLEDWVYLRLYTGAGYADRVLREHVAPLLREAQAQGLLRTWFFVRFLDDFEHLRLRLQARDRETLVQLHARLQARLAEAQRAGLLWRVQSDDYLPELQRYGGAAGLALCEQLFGVDSDDLLALLELEAAEGEAGDDAPPRWLYALASLDAYVLQLSPDAARREALLEKLARQFLDEQAGAAGRSAALVAVGARFRELRRELDGLRQGRGRLGLWQQQLAASARRRAPLLAALRELLTSLPEPQQEQVLQSLLHMHCNRLAPSDPRRHETLLYDFARRLERARQARSPELAR